MNEELVKLAFKLGYSQALTKSATPFSDIGLSMFSPVNGSLSNAIGAASGQMSNPATEDDLDEYDDHPFRALAPGVGSHRLERRIKKSLTDSSGNSRHYLSQNFGGLTSALLGAGLGAGAGALLADKGDRATGAAVGAGAGVVLPQVLAAITALVRRRRNKDEHKKYIESSTLPEYFIPGLASYNRYKTIGHEQGNSLERMKQKGKAMDPKELAELALAALNAQNQGADKKD